MRGEEKHCVFDLTKNVIDFSVITNHFGNFGRRGISVGGFDGQNLAGNGGNAFTNFISFLQFLFGL